MRTHNIIAHRKIYPISSESQRNDRPVLWVEVEIDDIIPPKIQASSLDHKATEAPSGPQVSGMVRQIHVLILSVVSFYSISRLKLRYEWVTTTGKEQMRDSQDRLTFRNFGKIYTTALHPFPDASNWICAKSSDNLIASWECIIYKKHGMSERFEFELRFELVSITIIQ